MYEQFVAWVSYTFRYFVQDNDHARLPRMQMRLLMIDDLYVLESQWLAFSSTQIMAKIVHICSYIHIRPGQNNPCQSALQ